MTEHSGKIPILVICGATATGKTRAAIAAAKQCGGEIISADSMQIYKGLDVGTAKPSADELAAAPHHLIGFVEPEQPYSAADYLRDATAAIEDIHSRGKKVIVAGGTGLYISSLIRGYGFAPAVNNPQVRERLNSEYRERGIEPLFERLKMADPEYAAKIHPNNTKRVIRALEMCEGGRKPTEQERISATAPPPYDASVVWLDYSEREALYRAIENRVDSMLSAGLLAEAEYVYLNRSRFVTAAQAIGYKEFFSYFEGASKLDECVQELKKQTRHYAKRQLSWFRGMSIQKKIFVDAPDYRPECKSWSVLVK